MQKKWAPSSLLTGLLGVVIATVAIILGSLFIWVGMIGGGIALVLIGALFIVGAMIALGQLRVRKSP